MPKKKPSEIIQEKVEQMASLVENAERTYNGLYIEAIMEYLDEQEE